MPDDNISGVARSAHGDVRARIGPPDRLAERSPIPVLEDAAHGGLAWEDAELRLLSAERAAVLLIQSDVGVHGIVINGRGARALVSPPR